jgi:hypothetical protein
VCNHISWLAADTAAPAATATTTAAAGITAGVTKTTCKHEVTIALNNLIIYINNTVHNARKVSTIIDNTVCHSNAFKNAVNKINNC